LRDVGEDLIRGRGYLPAELLDKYDVSIDELRQGRVGQGYVTLLEDLTIQARELYRLGWKGIPPLHGIAAPAVGIAALSYEGILAKLEKNQYDNLASRAYLRPLERFAIDEEREARKVT
jgi:phytoene synthase